MRIMPQSQIGLATAIADGRGGFAADRGGDRIDAETAFAGQAVVLADLREGREHQQLARRAGVKVGPAGLEVGAEAARHDHDERLAGLAHGAGDRLFARRDAARDDDTAACAEEQGLVDLVFNVDWAGAARDLNEHLVGRFEQKGVADGVDCFAERVLCVVWRRGCARQDVGCARQDIGEADRARDLEEIGVLHDGPATRGISPHIANHGTKLAFAEEDRIVEAGEPEGCRAVDLKGRDKGEIGLGAGDLETADDFAQRRSEPLVYADDAVEMLGHGGEWAGSDIGEHMAKVLPSAGNRFAQRRGGESPSTDFAQNRPTAFHDERDHVEPRLAIIPARQPDAGLEMPVLVALANVWPRKHVVGIIINEERTVNGGCEI